jgi:uncharacterized glyoxalase superfamily protein PhnB
MLGRKATTATLVSAMRYRDADAAVDFLIRAFGFAEHAVFRDEQGHVVHAELSFGNGMIMIGPDSQSEFGRFTAFPKDIGGRCTQTVYCIIDDPDAHHDRAKAAGAEIVMPLTDQHYGGRDYSARDIEGHIWSFGTYDPWIKRE